MALFDKMKERRIKQRNKFREKLGLNAILPSNSNKSILQKKDSDVDLSSIESKYLVVGKTKKYKKLLTFCALFIGLIIFVCMFDVAYKVFTIDTTQYHIITYVVSALLLGAYIGLFIVPVVKVLKAPHFITKPEGSKENKRRAEKHNKKLRNDLATAIVNLNNSEEIYNARWYYEDENNQEKNDDIIEGLTKALNEKNDELVQVCLDALYRGPIKKTAKKIVNKTSIRSGFYSAVSQSNTLDAVIVASLNMKMIKDIVYLYGFRPDEIEMTKIYGGVIKNAFVALGVASIPAGNMVGNVVSKYTESVPVLGSVIKTIVDPLVQGSTNAILTSLLGVQTVRYILKDYKLSAALKEETVAGKSVYELEKDIWKQNVEDVKRETSSNNIEKTREEIVSSMFA